MKKKPKWTACSHRNIISPVFPTALQINSDHLSLSTMYKPLKHPRRLYFLSSVDSISKTLFKDSVSTGKTISVTVKSDHFIFKRWWGKKKNTVEACGCCNILKL